ncbi:MAG: cation:proton antiporter [Microthrixaceae bacterium]
MTERLELVTTSVLLPMLFFVVVGLSTNLGLLNAAALWAVTAVVVIVAIGGKLGGSAVTARLMGETWQDSLTIGVLMNTGDLLRS